MYGEYSGAPVDYQPLMIVTYWGFRMMIGFGVLSAAFAALALVLTRKGTVPQAKWLNTLAVLSIFAPFIANTAGWVFTEMGRQPFVVAPNPDPSGVDGVFLYTAAAVSPSVTATELLFSLITLTLLYGALMVVELKLIIKYTRGGVASALPELDTRNNKPTVDAKNDDVLAFAY